MGKIIVTGTPGSGKSTILSKIRSNVRIINFADEMIELMQEKGVQDRDQVRHVAYSLTTSVRSEVIKRLNEVKEDALIDTHASVKSRSRYIPGFSTSDLNLLKDIKGIIYIEAHVNEILMRRLTDKTRVRENDFEDEIQEQRRVNLSLASYFASHLDVPLYIIMNRQSMLEKAVEETEKAINDALGRAEWVTK